MCTELLVAVEIGWGGRMGAFASEIARSLPPGLSLPHELVAAFDWMESVGAVGRMKNGQYVGMTDPEALNQSGGCLVHFYPADPRVVRAWTGSNASDLDRLAPIAQTGSDGSMAGLWRDDDGRIRIVHLGSGSGSISVGIFTRSPLDFLRLLAVGYQELCWPDEYEMLPIETCFDRSTYRPPTRFRSWLTSTYSVTIPSTAAPLVLPMANIGEPSDDPFCRWLTALTA